MPIRYFHQIHTGVTCVKLLMEIWELKTSGSHTFNQKYPKFSSTELPAAFLANSTEVTQLLTAAELNSVKSIKELTVLVDSKLE